MRRWNKKIYTEYMRERELRNRPSAASHNELKPHKTPETFYENKLFFAHIAIEMRQQGCSIYYSNSSNIRRRPLSLTNRFAEYCQVFFYTYLAVIVSGILRVLFQTGFSVDGKTCDVSSDNEYATNLSLQLYFLLDNYFEMLLNLPEGMLLNHIICMG